MAPPWDSTNRSALSSTDSAMRRSLETRATESSALACTSCTPVSATDTLKRDESRSRIDRTTDRFSFSEEHPGRESSHVCDATTTVTLTRAAFNDLILRVRSFPELVAAGEIALAGDPTALMAWFGALDTPAFWFHVVEP